MCEPARLTTEFVTALAGVQNTYWIAAFNQEQNDILKIISRMDLDPDDFLRNYETDLRGMSRADKGIINSLTMLAADYATNCELRVGIVRTIEKVVTTASPNLKLIPLYLMDSIVKNVGGAYSSLFMTNLTPTFCDAFVVVDNKTRQSFIKLLDTWQTQSVFSQQKNDEIRLRLAAILTAEANSERPTSSQTSVLNSSPVAPGPSAHFPGSRLPLPGFPGNDGFPPNLRPPQPSVQEQLAASQNRVHSLLGSLRGSAGPPSQIPPAHVQPPMPPMPPQHGPPGHMMMPHQNPGWQPQPQSQPQQIHHSHPMQGPMNPGMHHMQPPPVPQFQPQIPQSLVPQGPQGHFPPHLGPPMPPAQPPLAVQGPPHSGFPLQNMMTSVPQNLQLPSRPQEPPRIPGPPPGPIFFQGALRPLNSSELNSQDVTPFIRDLYDEQPFECKSDGRRFRCKEDLEKHLDKLFAVNKARKECTGIKERPWYRRVEDWVACADVVERPTAAGTPGTDGMDPATRVDSDVPMADVKTEEEDKSHRVPADDFDHGVRCAACNEELQRCYDGEEDCWVFKGVVRASPAGQLDEQGRILVHRKCFQPGHRFSDLLSPVPSTPRATAGEHQWVSVKTEGPLA